MRSSARCRDTAAEQTDPPTADLVRRPSWPQAIRAATGEAKFNITSDLQSIPPSTRMTGSMPLVDEQSLSSVDFALPEYDDGDFSADMEPPPDPRSRSAKGERHAEEISKILAETDVYMKYGLHQKAVDHLRRVFTLDDENVEAHERLKDILVSQGREQEAEEELLKLAELVAPADPDRAEAYLQELLGMNGTHTGAFELARRFRLRVARMSSSVSEVEYQGGGIAEVESDLEELDLSTPPPARAAPRRHSSRDSLDEFDADDLIGDLRQIAHGSPAPSRPPQRPRGNHYTDESFEIDFDSQQGQSTRQVPPEQIEALANMPEDYDDGALLVDRPPFEEGNSLDEALEAQLDDDVRSARTSIRASLPSSVLASRTRTCRSIPTKHARSTRRWARRARPMRPMPTRSRPRRRRRRTRRPSSPSKAATIHTRTAIRPR